MKHFIIYFLIGIAFISCKKKEKTIEEPTPEIPTTFSFYKSITVWDSVYAMPAVVKNSKFKLTVFKNNQPDKVIYSDNDKFYFENFKPGKYDVLIEDPANNFTSFRDSILIDTTRLKLQTAELIKYPSFKFKRYTVTEGTDAIAFILTANPVKQFVSYCVFFNTTNTLNMSYKNQLYDYSSYESSESQTPNNGGPESMYRVQGDVGFASPDSISQWGFNIFPALFKQHFNFHTGDSIYLFVVPAVSHYYYTSYIRDYNAKYDSHSQLHVKHYTGINTNHVLTIPYKFK